MKRKYQVFVSSTYEDLREARREVILYLLDNNCIPVGMEQFPSSNMEQMEYIKKMLEDCDYYILILAGKYGTLDSDGVSFTEKEFNYAQKKGIPIMSFLVKDIDSLQGFQLEKSDEKKTKLLSFREKVCKDKLVNFYTNIDDLKAKIGTSLYRCIEDFPRNGWIRASSSLEVGEEIPQDIIKRIRDEIITDEEIDELYKLLGEN